MADRSAAVSCVLFVRSRCYASPPPPPTPFSPGANSTCRRTGLRGGWTAEGWSPIGNGSARQPASLSSRNRRRSRCGWGSWCWWCLGACGGVAGGEVWWILVLEKLVGLEGLLDLEGVDGGVAPSLHGEGDFEGLVGGKVGRWFGRVGGIGAPNGVRGWSTEAWLRRYMGRKMKK